MKRYSAPNAAEFERLRRHGLVAEAATDQNDDCGFDFSAANNTCKLNAILREALPAVFEHLAEKDPWILRDDPKDYETKALPYVLLVRNRNQFTYPVIKKPTRSDILRLYPTKGRSWKSRTVWLGKQQR